VLTVNAAEIDLVSSEGDYAGLLAEVARARRGRHYFNPMKSLL
jgi:deoxyguanosine kinase